MSIEILTFGMEELLNSFTTKGDPAVLREPEAERLSERLYYSVDWFAPCTEAVESARALNIAMLLAPFYWSRFEYDRVRQDADRALFFYRLVRQVAPHHVPDALLEIYAEQGNPVSEGLSTRELAAYTAHGVYLLKEAETNGDPRLLDDAVAVCLFAARANPREDVTWAESLITLGNVLTRRYEYTGNADSLERAFFVTVKAAQAIPEGDPCRLKASSGMGHIAIRMYQRTGDLDELDLAVRALREAAYEAPDDDPHRAAYLTNLSSALSHHYHHTGRVDSANEALEAQFEAVRITPRDHPDLPSRLTNLAAALQSHPGSVPPEADRYDQAVTVLRDALSLLTDGHPDRPGCLRLLAVALQDRFTHQRDPRDLTEAVAAARAALLAGSPDDYQRPNLLRSLADSLRKYARHFSEPDVLGEAVEALQEADALLPEDHPDRTDVLATLGFLLRERFDTTADLADRDKAVRALRAASAVDSAPARDRTRAAAAAGHIAAEAQDFAGAVESFALALDQLELTAWRGLRRDDRERLIAQFPHLVAHAAAVAVRAGQAERAVELLEQGRGILLAQALETRTDHKSLLARALEKHTDHEALLARASRLADELRQVLDELDRLPDSPYSSAMADVYERRRANERRAALARQREELLAGIRELPGLAGFLRPPSFDTLRAAADRGPVVLLSASEHGCHALLLTTAGVRVLTLALEDVELAEHVDHFTRAVGGETSPLTAVTTIEETLTWLWDAVAEPVLEALGHTEPPRPGTEWPRLWWCPTGLFTLLPLHAAGRKIPHGGGDSVLDRVVSSYTPTLRALLHARNQPRPHQRSSAGKHGARGLIVSLPSTPGWADLPAAEREARELHHRHPDAELLTGPAATAPSVREALGRCSWAHFACHGMQDLGRPSRGALILHDGPLTLRDIANLRLPHARFAFLSACETSRGGIVLADEAISFAAALQLAGFPDVIGTLWSIDDTLAPDVAGLVYEDLSCPPRPGTSPDPAAALHAAVRAVRAEHPRAVTRWAPYVHVGP
ncbi:CHAT domain-containing protein [Streptomyces sp. JB150]|uniref:CHAT domain-containing protein n=1 Tax=Streptomyces sp. JB150 TaxID=2714844 RepID=UPI00140BE469|nr:CHAT domain-containing protein [Streptomyces sp. JB150]QIJ61004.1 CHAT domain-containing protein [Streptomyces sp. JB150]